MNLKLKQIIDMEGDRITEVSSGTINTSSHNLSDRCFPLSLQIKNVSDSAQYWSNKFHASKINGLNHPDLNRALIDRWVEICENIENEEVVKELYDRLHEFGNSVLMKIDNLKYETVHGINLFR